MGASPTERIVNLALYMASAPRPVSAREIAGAVAGYPPDQADAAFGRMFERDKKDLRRAGFVIEVDHDTEVERYRFDPRATYSDAVDLKPVEAVMLRAAAAAMLTDPSFPYPDDLRLALAKLIAAADGAIGHSSAVRSALNADEDPSSQGAAVAALTHAIGARKCASFSYTGAGGKASRRTVEPRGLFARDGRWYLVARDPAVDDIRVFAVARIGGLSVDPRRPETPDFDPPVGFDVRTWMLMPFQYGPQTGEALLRLTGSASRRAEALVGGQGSLKRAGSDAYLWRLPYADETLLARWIAANGPGIEIVSPASLRDTLVDGMRTVMEQHA
jgi:predicted DNA-binding transcriptional regulator YafY